MNKRDINFISMIFPHYYGRIDTTQIDIKQLGRCISKSDIKQKNPFLAYSITLKSQQQIREDKIDFNQLMHRMNQTLLSKNDNMTLQMIMQVLDQDKDGYIGVEDIVKINQQIGGYLPKQKIQQLVQNFCREGDKISKNQLMSIFWA